MVTIVGAAVAPFPALAAGTITIHDGLFSGIAFTMAVVAGFLAWQLKRTKRALVHSRAQGVEDMRAAEAANARAVSFANRIRELRETVVQLQAEAATITRDADAVRKAKDIAVAANKSKTEFLAMMSHELRTPLNAILGFSEIIRSEALGKLGAEEYKEYAGDIYTSGAHLLALINDLLDLAKVESGMV
ncbi:MAG: sensor histidine kinase, partial [Alphaproteobacteria bacterium]